MWMSRLTPSSTQASCRCLEVRGGEESRRILHKTPSHPVGVLCRQFKGKSEVTDGCDLRARRPESLVAVPSYMAMWWKRMFLYPRRASLSQQWRARGRNARGLPCRRLKPFVPVARSMVMHLSSGLPFNSTRYSCYLRVSYVVQRADEVALVTPPCRTRSLSLS